jgi:hypothetical protein
MIVLGEQKMVSIALLFAIKNLWLPYKWQPKIGFGFHLRNVDHWMETNFFGYLVIELGKWACNMESFY